MCIGLSCRKGQLCQLKYNDSKVSHKQDMILPYSKKDNMSDE